MGFLTTMKSLNGIVLRTEQVFCYKRRIMTEKNAQRHTTAVKETQKSNLSSNLWQLDLIENDLWTPQCDAEAGHSQGKSI
jgi:hypothetical protein